MGKPKKSNVASVRKVPLDEQIMDGKVAKQKDRKKINFRAEESSVLYLHYLKRDVIL